MSMSFDYFKFVDMNRKRIKLLHFVKLIFNYLSMLKIAVLWIRSRIRIRKDPELLPDPDP
jgi:hypothetical protein